jgi:2-polyprenyl-6-methoxyphenol hydroxylase-like FAD-dependent oxidoreductase
MHFLTSLPLQLGAKTLKGDKLLAFYSLFVSSGGDGDRRTLIEATESGWWYSSSLPHNRRIVVYHTDDDDPSAKLVRTPDGFLDLLHNQSQHISSILTANDYDFLPGLKYPRPTAANSSVLSPICDDVEHWCAVGDAAMAFDPLSSQGMITALNAGCFIGEELAKRISMKLEGVKSDGIDSISEYYAAVSEKYEREKRQYYRLSRFEGGFWAKRRL